MLIIIRVSARCILKKSDPAEVAAACDKLDLQVEQVSERKATKCGWNLSSYDGCYAPSAVP